MDKLQLAPSYDVIVIGAGIGGLVCGTFLAKASKKVLIIEQHHTPGGYCTSFKRKGFIFDSAVHHIGGCGRWSIVGRCLKELNISMEFYRLDPMDSLVFPSMRLDIPAEMEEYIALLQQKYPAEKDSIGSFFKDFTKLYWATINDDENSPLINKYKGLTFKETLDEFSDNDELKMLLSAQWGYVGSPPNEVSSIGMCQMLVNYLKDGAYYPKGGTQKFADAITKRFTELGGQLLLSSKVEKILLNNKAVTGVKLEGGREILADTIVSNIDAKQTFFTLTKDEEIEDAYLHKLYSMKESASFFLLYLGLGPDVNLSNLKRGFYHSDTSFSKDGWKYISVPTRVDSTIAPVGKQIVSVVVSLRNSYNDVQDWDTFKEDMKNSTIKFLETYVPNLSRSIEVIEAATPKTLERYTLNSKGAAYGWAVTPQQTGKERLPHETPIENLYLAGHWTNPGPGVCAVVSSGWRAANLILRKPSYAANSI
ncbi:MAG TPA: NAD(P)/FAD-dependent oxidoreductase [Candidatus Brocadiales bacterium]|nr:NAD(P)/FAD-dependent oxidoreductase [Candidatus Brocadiales bacterium]